jgi:Flp pilus assembly pilin Flp
MRSLPQGFISINTGSNALSCGLIAALAAIAMVIGIARFDLTRPVDHPLSPKLHGQAEHVS